MRFLELTYRKFGPFDHLTLDLSQGRHGLHIIYGPNEAGKTAALRGLGFLLFGFPHGTCDDYRYKHTDQRVGATLAGRDGRELTCLRRRGRGLKNTLHAADGKTAITEEEVQRLVGGLSAEQFDMLFGLSHGRLVEGGRAITEGKGEIGAALFEAGAGMAGLRRLEKLLEAKQNERYKPRGHNQDVPVCLRELAENREQLRAATLRIEAWREQEESLRRAVAEKKRLEGERTRDRAEIGRLSAFRAALPTIDALRELEESLRPLEAIPLLRDQYADECRAAVADLEVARSNRERCDEDLRRLTEDLQALNPSAAVLAEGAAIERLQSELGARQKAEADRPGLFARMREHQTNARTVLVKNFGLHRVEEAEQLRLSDADVDRIRRLGQSRQSLVDAVASQKGRLSKLLVRIEEDQQRLRDTAILPDVRDLRTAYEAWAQEGPLESQLRDAENQLADKTQPAEDGLKRLAFYWSGTLERVSALAVPLPATVQHHQHVWQGLDEQIRDRDRRLGEVAVNIDSLNEQIDGLLHGGDLPSEEELHALREDRNAGLLLVRREWLDGRPDEAARREFVGRHAADGHLLDAVEAAVKTCDEAADALRREAERATLLSETRARLAKETERGDDLSARREELLRDRERVRREWRDLWRTSGVDPRTPFEMSQFLSELASVRQRVDALRTDATAVERLRERVESGKRRLQEALDLSLDGPTPSLAQLLQAARRRLEESDESHRVRGELENRIRALREEQAGTEEELRRAAEDLEGWRRDWARAVEPIRLSEKDEPLTAFRYLDQIADISGELGDARILELRVNGIDRDREQFLTALNALRTRLDGPGVSPSTAESMQADVDALLRRLNEARDLRTRRDLLEGQRGQAEERWRGLDEKVRRLEARLEVLREEACVSDVTEIPAVIQHSTERRRIERRIQEERNKLRTQARSQSLETFRAEALAERDGLDSRLGDLEGGVEPLDAEINRQVEVEVAARQKLEDWRQAHAEAADHRQQGEHLLTRLRRHVEEFAVLHLAREVLRRAVERYRSKNQGTLLDRAGWFFRALTDAAFVGLEVEEADDGLPTLLAVRADPEERVAVGGLSDGTRDQLFFGLRLAAIEQRLQAREPMPLAVDDILVNYDDRRSLATLRCLAELSDKTQVLFFTHHQHLVNLAGKNLSNKSVFYHSLEAVRELQGNG